MGCPYIYQDQPSLLRNLAFATPPSSNQQLKEFFKAIPNNKELQEEIITPTKENMKFKVIIGGNTRRMEQLTQALNTAGVEMPKATDMTDEIAEAATPAKRSDWLVSILLSYGVTTLTRSRQKQRATTSENWWLVASRLSAVSPLIGMDEPWPSFS